MSFKKIVAREGLILIGFLLLSAGCFIAMINFQVFGEIGERLVPLFFWVAVYGYPAFLVVRFILWAAKTLKQD